mmetsp:Transcript_15061/g.34295  ORF Transcript_15061/g.34295 Transcript_15061/m.34295 type:complete len:468 (+) Transcript_15061:140-1543(+)
MQADLDILQALILYLGLLILALWRFFVPLREGKQSPWRNYLVGLYALVTALFVFEFVLFCFACYRDIATQYKMSASDAASLAVASTPLAGGRQNFLQSVEVFVNAFAGRHKPHGNGTSYNGTLVPSGAHALAAGGTNSASQLLQGDEVNWPVPYLRLLVLVCPIFFILTLTLCVLQSRHHLKEIMNGCAVAQHDRALNIIALPAVYSVMCFSALARLYILVTEEVIAAEEGGGAEDFTVTQSLAFARYETCLHIGDLYEAWALYQFGKLTCELLEGDFFKETTSSSSHGVSAAEAVYAVSSVMWVGSWLFISVCLVQAGWTLFMWLFRPPQGDDAADYHELLKQFYFAGMVASAAAIYNVHVVERTFGQYIPGYAPLLKFLSVKLLVFFAFWQGAVVWCLEKAGILNFTEVQGRVFHVALLMIECFLASVVHWFAWDHREVWYATVPDEDRVKGDSESTALLGKRNA